MVFPSESVVSASASLFSQISGFLTLVPSPWEEPGVEKPHAFHFVQGVVGPVFPASEPNVLRCCSSWATDTTARAGSQVSTGGSEQRVLAG